MLLDTTKSTTDTLFAAPRAQIVDFAFDQSVTDVFPDMIKRSVPGYETIIALLAVLAERYYQAGTSVYDLGCSVGAATLAVHARLGCNCAKYVAIDSSASMIQQCRQNLIAHIETKLFVCRQRDIRQIEIENASVVIVNFTLQFLPAADRDKLLTRIYQGMRAGGVFILSEKLHADTAAEATLLLDFYHSFKAANGYSDLEISQKRTALEQVMQLDSPSVQRQRLERAGFSPIQNWFQCFNFNSVVALK